MELKANLFHSLFLARPLLSSVTTFQSHWTPNKQQIWSAHFNMKRTHSKRNGDEGSDLKTLHLLRKHKQEFHREGRAAQFVLHTLNLTTKRWRQIVMSQVALYSRVGWKVSGLTLLLRVGTLWRCGDGLFFEVHPSASDGLLTTLHPLLENVLQTVDHLEISCLKEPFSWLEKPRNRMGRDLNWSLCSPWKNWIGGTPLEHSPYSPYLTPWDLWGFPTMKRKLRGKKFRSD
jgi:hypothetical protein